MPQRQNKLFEYTDGHGTKVGLVEIVAGWKKDLRVRISGIEVTRNTWMNKETTESVSMPIKSPEELADFVSQLRDFLDNSREKCDFSLGSHGRGCGTLLREGDGTITWQDLNGRVSGSRYGFHVEEQTLRLILEEAARYE